MSKVIYQQDGEVKKNLTEDMKGEESFAGSMPDPDNDPGVQDTTEAEHEIGLYETEDENHPKEAGLAEEVNKAEDEHFEKGL